MVTRTKVDRQMDREELNVRPDSRISGFYKKSLSERMKTLVQRGVLGEEDVNLLMERRGGLPLETADKMVENLIGVMELPPGTQLPWHGVAWISRLR